MTAEMTIAVILGVGLGGAAGAVLRLLLDRLLPWGILLANTVGCLALGLLYGWITVVPAAAEPGTTTAPLLVALATGLLGALSTFATVSLRAAERWVAGRRLAAAGLWAVHVLCGGAAAAAGIAAARLMLG